MNRAPENRSRQRIRIYQLFPRLFGNINETRRYNGTLAENGVGKFADINDAALASLRAMGFTHLWLTGVLRHATATDYSAAGLPADDPDLLKGLAGSPFAVTDPVVMSLMSRLLGSRRTLPGGREVPAIRAVILRISVYHYLFTAESVLT